MVFTSKPEITRLIEECMSRPGEGAQFVEEARQYIRERCKKDLWFLAYYVLDMVDINTPLHREMATTWMKRAHRRYTLWLIPRGHLKTSLWTSAGAIWRWLNDPNRRILLCNAVASNASAILIDIRTYFDTNEKLRWLFPEYCIDLHPNRARAKLCKWTEDRIDFPCGNRVGRKEGNMECLGVEASLVSKHFDELWFDDPVNDLNSETKKYRDKVYQWILKAYQLRDNPITSIIKVIGTPWHFDDLHARIQKQEAIRRAKGKKPKWLIYKRYVLEKDGVYHPEGTPIWPERFTKSSIEDIKEQIGSFLFNCNYAMNPVPPDTAMFRRENIKRIDEYDLPDNLVNFSALDLAEEDTTEGDYTGTIVCSVDKNFNFYVRYIYKGKAYPLDLVDNLITLQNSWKMVRVGMETISFQKSIMKHYKQEAAKRRIHIPFEEMKRGHASKYKRILAIQPVVESGRFYICDGIPNADELIDEMITYPKPTNDDLLDCLADIVALAHSAPLPAIKDNRLMTIDNLFGPLYETEEDDIALDSAWIGN